MSKQNSFTYEELLSCGRGEMFGPGNAQLPLPPMLMISRIVSITEDGGKYGNGQIIAELDIDPDMWFFKCHFENDPVMGGPGRGRALGSGEVKFTGQVLPTGKLVTYKIDLKRVIMRKLVMGIADATMELDGREIYAANDLRVGLFTRTDNF